MNLSDERNHVYNDQYGNLQTAPCRILSIGKLTKNQFDVAGQCLPQDFLAKSYGGATLTYTENSNNVIGTIQGDGEAVEIQQREKTIFQPNIQYRVFFEGIFCDISSSADYKCEVGVFTNKDGVFFRASQNELKFVLRSSRTGSVVEEEVGFDDFNLKPDELVSIDFTKYTQWFIELHGEQFLFGMLKNNSIYYLHRINKQNTSGNSVFQTQALPCRWLFRNGSGASLGSPHKTYFQQYSVHAYSQTSLETESLAKVRQIISGEITLASTASKTITLKTRASQKQHHQIKNMKLRIVETTAQKAKQVIARQKLFQSTSPLTDSSFVSTSLIGSNFEYDISATAVDVSQPNVKNIISYYNDELVQEYEIISGKGDWVSPSEIIAHEDTVYFDYLIIDIQNLAGSNCTFKWSITFDEAY